MNKTARLLLVGVIIIALTMPAMAFRGKRDHRGGHARYANCDFWSTELNLTDAQKTKIEKLRNAQLEKRKAYRTAIQKLATKKRALMTADKIDKKAIYAKIDEMSKMRAKWQKEMLDHRTKMRSILTPEQIKKITEHRKNCMACSKKGAKFMSHHKRFKKSGCRR